MKLHNEIIQLLIEILSDEFGKLFYVDEETWNDMMWATSPKESIIKVALSELKTPINVVEKMWTIYNTLITINQDILYEFAKTIADIALEGNPCHRKISKYICHGDTVPPVVIDAITHGGRITAVYTAESIIDGSDADVLTQLALVNARFVSTSVLEKFVDILYSKVIKNPTVLIRFYRLYNDYIETSAERGTINILRKLAIVHYFGETPREARPVLETIIKRVTAEGDVKTAEFISTIMASLNREMLPKDSS